MQHNAPKQQTGMKQKNIVSSELFLGKDAVGKYKAQEESKRLRGEGYQVKFIDFRFERRGKLQDSGKEEERKAFPTL